MNKEAFLKPSTKTETVTLPDGSTAKIRKLTQGEVETSLKMVKAGNELAAARYTVRCATINDDGSPMFAEADDTALAAADFEQVNAIAVAISRFSGLTVPKNG